MVYLILNNLWRLVCAGQMVRGTNFISGSPPPILLTGALQRSLNSVTLTGERGRPEVAAGVAHPGRAYGRTEAAETLRKHGLASLASPCEVCEARAVSAMPGVHRDHPARIAKPVHSCVRDLGCIGTALMSSAKPGVQRDHPARFAKPVQSWVHWERLCELCEAWST